MAKKRGPIRVGMIRCDERALWYGAIFDDIDPIAYDAWDPAPYHHMTYYSRVELMIDKAKGFKLAKAYDRDRKKAERFAAAFRTKVEVARSLDEVTDDVDVVMIANASGDGGDHLRLATPGLKKGLPTFIDRPFARSVKDAKAMIALAKRKRTPLLSCSHVRMMPLVNFFKARFPEIGRIGSGFVQGRGPNPALIADGIELALHVFGDDFKGKVDAVQSMGNWPNEVMLIRYWNRRTDRRLQASVLNSHGGDYRNTFWAKAISSRSHVNSEDLDYFVQPPGGLAVMNAIKKMARTGKPTLAYSEMIESVAVTQAGRRSHNKARMVPVKRLR